MKKTAIVHPLVKAIIVVLGLGLIFVIATPYLVTRMTTPDPERVYSQNFETPLGNVKIVEYGGGIHGHSWFKFTSREAPVLKKAGEYAPVPFGSSDSLSKALESLRVNIPEDLDILSDSNNLLCRLHTEKLSGNHKRVQWFISHNEKPVYYFWRN